MLPCSVLIMILIDIKEAITFFYFARTGRNEINGPMQCSRWDPHPYNSTAHLDCLSKRCLRSFRESWVKTGVFFCSSSGNITEAPLNLHRLGGASVSQEILLFWGSLLQGFALHGMTYSDRDLLKASSTHLIIGFAKSLVILWVWFTSFIVIRQGLSLTAWSHYFM